MKNLIPIIILICGCAHASGSKRVELDGNCTKRDVKSALKSVMKEELGARLLEETFEELQRIYLDDMEVELKREHVSIKPRYHKGLLGEQWVKLKMVIHDETETVRTFLLVAVDKKREWTDYLKVKATINRYAEKWTDLGELTYYICGLKLEPNTKRPVTYYLVNPTTGGIVLEVSRDVLFQTTELEFIADS